MHIPSEAQQVTPYSKGKRTPRLISLLAMALAFVWLSGPATAFTSPKLELQSPTQRAQPVIFKKIKKKIKKLRKREKVQVCHQSRRGKFRIITVPTHSLRTWPGG